METNIEISQELKTTLEKWKEKLDPFDEKIESLEKDIAEQKKEKLETIRNFTINCLRCGKINKFSELAFVQVYDYVAPSGCMDGDYNKDCKDELCHLKCFCGAGYYIYNMAEKKAMLYAIGQFPKELVFNSVERKRRY